MAEYDHLKLIEWVESSLKDLRNFPVAVRRDVGAALLLAQKGGKADSVAPLKGYGGAGVLEVIEDHRGDTFRAVYRVRFATAVYVRHAFMKKSKSGRETPKADMGNRIWKIWLPSPRDRLGIGDFVRKRLSQAHAPNSLIDLGTPRQTVETEPRGRHRYNLNATSLMIGAT